jgi:hypothetical protein
MINRLIGAFIAGSALGSMFEVPNSNIALPMKISRGKVFMFRPPSPPSTARRLSLNVICDARRN